MKTSPKHIEIKGLPTSVIATRSNVLIVCGVYVRFGFQDEQVIRDTDSSFRADFK